ncbi:MAG: hypothetical protein ACI4DP_03740 [Candidatus Ornithomonoglobus sp.]
MNGANQSRKPEIVVFAGPNGSGKSTFTELLKPPIDYINADKIISRYNRALDLVKEVVSVSDICHIYDNSNEEPFRIFKRRKDQCCFQECNEWHREDIELLTSVTDMNKADLND